MSTLYKMKGSSALGYGNQHSSTKGMPFASPAKDTPHTTTEDHAAHEEKKDKRSTVRKVWDKATQIGMGLKGSLYAESTSSRNNIPASFSDAYNKEKKADEKAGES